MRRCLSLVMALALVIGMHCLAFAEVQNVKVSGDILMRAVSRSNFSLVNGAAGDKNDYQGSYFLSHTRVKIDADLTENVSTTFRLINERNWDQESTTNSDIDLDLAYVALKDFLNSPMTLTLGRQEIGFGKGFIIGDGNSYSTAANTLANGVPDDLSLRSAFDAIRATMNYDPLIVDVIYAKADENDANRSDDTDLYGLNAHYVLSPKSSVDGYFFTKTNSNTDKTDKVNTVGALFMTSPIDNLMTSLEMAFQFGKMSGSSTDAATKRRAWAMQAMADYSFAGKKMDPTLGLYFTYVSGDKSTTDNTYNAWDAMYEAQAPNALTDAIFPATNVACINLVGSIKPTEDTKLIANYGHYILTKKRATFTNMYTGSTLNLDNKSTNAGDAVDLTALYDYTEDVQFGLTFGMFAPGKAFREANRDATQVIGSMKVTF